MGRLLFGLLLLASAVALAAEPIETGSARFYVDRTAARGLQFTVNGRAYPDRELLEALGAAYDGAKEGQWLAVLASSEVTLGDLQGIRAMAAKVGFRQYRFFQYSRERKLVWEVTLERAGSPLDGPASATLADAPSAHTFGEVVLSGEIFTKTEYGPPNFENDGVSRKVIVKLLKLARAISVEPTAADRNEWDPVASIRVIQIVEMPGVNLAGAVGHRAKIKGVLEGARTGHHYTKAILVVSKNEDVEVLLGSPR